MIESWHATKRALERAQGANLIILWQIGRDATIADHAALGISKIAGHEYRIAIHCGATHVLVARDGVLITVIVKRG